MICMTSITETKSPLDQPLSLADHTGVLKSARETDFGPFDGRHDDEHNGVGSVEILASFDFIADKSSKQTPQLGQIRDENTIVCIREILV